MHERDLETEHPAPWRRVDQLGAARRELGERRADVVHLVGDVVNPRATLREEAADGRVVAERSKELDAAVADADRRGLDALVLDPRPVLEQAAEEPLVRPDGLVEIGDGEADVMDSPRLHGRDVSVRRR